VPRVNLSPLQRTGKLARIVATTLASTRRAAKIGFRSGGRVDRDGMAKAHLMWSDSLIDILSIDLKIEGVPVCTDPCLFLSNHISYLDIALIMQFVNRGNFGVYVSKSEVKDWPIFGRATTAGGTIYVDRKGDGSRKALAEAIRRSIRDLGHSVVLFPEGTSSLEAKVFKPGPFLTARDHDLLIQPLCLHYRPLREAAFIDDDSLVPHLWNLVGHPHIEATLVALPPRKYTTTDVEAASASTREEILTVFRELEARPPRHLP